MDPSQVMYLPPRRTYYYNPQWEHDYLFVQGTSGALCLVCGTVVTSVRKFNVERHYKTAHAKEYASVCGDDRVNLVNMLKEDLTHPQQQESDLGPGVMTLEAVTGGSPIPSPASADALHNSGGASKRPKLHFKAEPVDFEVEHTPLSPPSPAAPAPAAAAASSACQGAALATSSPPGEDEFAVVGRRFAFQLRAMREDQRLLAEKIIGDVMYYGRVGKLSETCFQYFPPPS